MTLYKVLDGGKSMHGGNGAWRKNRWRSVRGELIPCENGLYLCRRQDLIRWLGPEIWVAEHDGELVECDDKVVVRRARVVERLETWNDRTARLFAADCAEAVLHLFERERPGDDRPRLAIQAARDYANGVIGAAAGAAARAVAWAAAEAAARAAVEDAAEDAARAATRAAAGAAARAAARAAQTDLLLDYLEGRKT